MILLVNRKQILAEGRVIGDRDVTHSSRLKGWGWDPAGCQVSASKWRTHSLSLTAGQGHRKEMRRRRPSSKQCTWRRWSAWISWRTVKFYIQASSVVSETATATAINQTGDQCLSQVAGLALSPTRSRALQGHRLVSQSSMRQWGQASPPRQWHQGVVHRES